MKNNKLQPKRSAQNKRKPKRGSVRPTLILTANRVYAISVPNNVNRQINTIVSL